ncbi:MAG: N-acyl homoserine lactonase family protein [Proteobacteria bacterium]|nr:N-acyl homoserine lactonase family protein [Pseudomonadota bacterium]
MTEYVIHPLVVGINETDQGIMTYQQGYGTRIHLPIYVFYLEGGDQRIIVDTGLEDFMAPPDVEARYGFQVFEFEEALASVGLKPEDVDIVIQTHLHNDHCENTYKCKNARIIVQKAEYEFALNPHPIDHRYFPELLEGLNLEIIEGDREIAPGIRVMLTPGHTPGGQSVIVDTRAGKALITGFCANDKNFPASAPVVAPGVHLDAVEALESAQRAKAAADLLLPLHDLSLGARKRIPE